MNLKSLLGSASERQAFIAAVKQCNLDIMALTANGNQLHPTEGDRQSEALHDTIRLAGELGVDTVVLMSGLPEGAAGDKMPN
jgi:sugar phosphate isomerase/epimerase